MDNNHKETHDFMNVESFSQLPFIRPAPVKPEKAIRLFGIEFGIAGGDESESAETTPNNNNTASCEDSSTVNNKDSENNGGESGRRFECHYCCRNFPTSQALGGHQNAHKRERQHAKRAHLHSAMAHGSLSDYSLLNYHRLGSSPATTSYPSWNNGHNAVSRFYSSPHHASFSHHHQPPPPPPINGSPLALWRIPTVQSPANPSFHRDRSSSSALHQQLPMIGGASSSQATTGYGYESSKPRVQDNVSLDLHL